MEAQLVPGTEADALYHQMIDVSYQPESSVAIGSDYIGLGSIEHRGDKNCTVSRKMLIQKFQSMIGFMNTLLRFYGVSTL